MNTQRNAMPLQKQIHEKEERNGKSGRMAKDERVLSFFPNSGGSGNAKPKSGGGMIYTHTHIYIYMYRL